MTTLTADEVQHRLAAIAEGPWAQGLAEARQVFAPSDAIDVRPTKALVALDQLTLSPANTRKNRRLAVVLRSHFGDPAGVTDQEEIRKRDALDDALTMPQLYELAVETGYLPADSVRDTARSLFLELLWSPAAREFVRSYDYFAVPMLAARVGVGGLGPARAPEPNEALALRFAGFLAHLREFYADPRIEAWIAFLDDFVHEEGDQERFYRYLQGTSKDMPAFAPELLDGCMRFVTSLASAFFILDPDEQGRFGMVHAYWLQKFFGYQRDKGRYVKNVEDWGPTDSWARALETSPHLIVKGTDKALARIARRKFCEDVQVLARTFAAVRKLLKSARVRDAGPPVPQAPQRRPGRRGQRRPRR